MDPLVSFEFADKTRLAIPKLKTTFYSLTEIAQCGTLCMYLQYPAIPKTRAYIAITHYYKPFLEHEYLTRCDKKWLVFWACYFNKRDIAQTIVKYNHNYWEYGLRGAVMGQHKELAEYIQSTMGLSIDLVNEIYSCYKGNRPDMKLLPPETGIDTIEFFYVAMKWGNVQVLPLYKEHNIDIQDIDPDRACYLLYKNGFKQCIPLVIEFFKNKHDPFVLACILGDLQQIQEQKQHEQQDYALVIKSLTKGYEYACVLGHAHIVQFLVPNKFAWQKGLGLCSGFVRACRHGHVDIVRIVERYIFTVNKHSTLEYGMCSAAKYGKSNVLDYLESKSCYNMNEVATHACKGGHVSSVLRYKEYMNSEFRVALIENGHFGIFKLLFYRIKDGITYRITNMLEHGQYDMLKYLVSQLQKCDADINDSQWKRLINRQEIYLFKELLRLKLLSSKNALVHIFSSTSSDLVLFDVLDYVKQECALGREFVSATFNSRIIRQKAIPFTTKHHENMMNWCIAVWIMYAKTNVITVNMLQQVMAYSKEPDALAMIKIAFAKQEEQENKNKEEDVSGKSLFLSMVQYLTSLNKDHWSELLEYLATHVKEKQLLLTLLNQVYEQLNNKSSNELLKWDKILSVVIQGQGGCNRDVLQWFLSHGVDIKVCFALVSRHKKKDLIMYLLSSHNYKPRLSALNQLLCDACNSNDYDGAYLNVLIQCGANDFDRALGRACERRDIYAVNYLLKHMKPQQHVIEMALFKLKSSCNTTLSIIKLLFEHSKNHLDYIKEAFVSLCGENDTSLVIRNILNVYRDIPDDWIVEAVEKGTIDNIVVLVETRLDKIELVFETACKCEYHDTCETLLNYIFRDAAMHISKETDFFSMYYAIKNNTVKTLSRTARKPKPWPPIKKMDNGNESNTDDIVDNDSIPNDNSDDDNSSGNNSSDNDSNNGSDNDNDYENSSNNTVHNNHASHNNDNED
jgi:hypothetical protein